MKWLPDPAKLRSTLRVVEVASKVYVCYLLRSCLQLPLEEMAMSSVIPYEQFDCEDQQENLTENENAKIEEFDCEDEEEILADDENGRKPWSKVKYQLLEYHALPPFLRDNEYILGYYRSEWPLKQVLLSIFTIHNETLNVWT